MEQGAARKGPPPSISKNYPMSYSHYILRTKMLFEDKEKEEKFLSEVRTLLNTPFEEELTDGNGGSPLVGDGKVLLGSSKASGVMSVLMIDLFQPLPKKHLPFWIVQTDRLPYDTMVCAVLLLLKHHHPKTVEITTDGTKQDWEKAFSLYSYVFDRQPPPVAFEHKDVDNSL
jgi:hypothetical protein